MATAEDFQWIHDSLDDAACVTVVIGKDRDGVLEAFNADPSAIPIGEAEGYQPDIWMTWMTRTPAPALAAPT